jgi:DNA-binding NtrC family response regulator
MNYKNILQIDDDIDDCDFFQEALQCISNAVYTSINDPVEAMHKLVQNEIVPDVIFLDLNMHSMSGMEFLVEIKKKEALKNIPIIIFSTSSLHDIKSEAKKKGAYDFISKPSNFNELKIILTRYIS